MRTSVLSLLAAASVVSAQSSTVPAPKVTGNPVGATYVATLPIKEGSPLRGAIVAESGPDGAGVKFKVAFSGLPATGGPFMYHLHEKPVPADGNCTGTGAHLDPYKRGEVPICDASKPETCQTGDLSGKFGNITAGELSAEYVITVLTNVETSQTDQIIGTSTPTHPPTRRATPSSASSPSCFTCPTRPASDAPTSLCKVLPQFLHTAPAFPLLLPLATTTPP
jgi:hypothetical protein